jgi:hypothetical protein
VDFLEFLKSDLVYFDQSSLILGKRGGKSNLYQLVEHVKRIKCELSENGLRNQKGSFQFFYSSLVEAMREGKWVILDNVEQANQALLARLFPLMERSIEKGK